MDYDFYKCSICEKVKPAGDELVRKVAFSILNRKAQDDERKEARITAYYVLVCPECANMKSETENVKNNLSNSQTAETTKAESDELEITDAQKSAIEKMSEIKKVKITTLMKRALGKVKELNLLSYDEAMKVIREANRAEIPQ